MRKLAIFIFIGLVQICQGVEYFQQQVDYRISAKLVPAENIVIGSQEMIYHNNSPRTLDTLYLYLYLNAFKAGSNFDLELARRGQRRISDRRSANPGGIEIGSIRVGNITVDNYRIDDTIMKLPLPHPVESGDSIAVYFEFSSLIPSRGYRLGRRRDHFDIGQWYPKAAVYDRHGWHINQFQSMSEQYSDFGNYDIRITVPEEYLIAHCGKLMNETEIYGLELPIPARDSIIFDLLNAVRFDSLHDDSKDVWKPTDDLLYRFLINRQFQNLTDYADAPGTKTWIFKAEKVHDFAFSASPDFIIDRACTDGIIIDTYYKRFNRSFWSPRAVTTAREAITFFNRLIGPYTYDHYTLVSGVIYGGIEYPNLSMVIMYGGRDEEDHGFENIIAHEIAHCWFYGMIGSNQAEQSFIDEGFTSFLATLFIEHKFGRHNNGFAYEDPWRKRLLSNSNYRDELQMNYIAGFYDAIEEVADQPANSFGSMLAWRRASYDKAASALFHLQYIMGEHKFRQFLRELYYRWYLKHPYLADIEALASEIDGSDLRYFFRQWFETTWYLDYRLEGVKSRLVNLHDINWYETRIEIARSGKCISPLDLVIHYENGESDTLLLPVDIWADGKNYHVHEALLPLRPIYTELNPDGRIPDINRLNNNWRWPKIKFQFDTPNFLYEDSAVTHDPQRYIFYHQPGVWYNEVDGIKLGYGLNGTYLGKRHGIGAKIQVGCLNGRLDYDIYYQDILMMSEPRLRYKFAASESDGRGRQNAGLEFTSADANDVGSLNMSLSLTRDYLYSKTYLSTKQDWEYGDVNTLDMYFSRWRDYRRFTARYNLELITAAPGAEFRFSRFTARFDVSSRVSGRSKITATLLSGFSDGDVPAQYLFHLAEGSPYMYGLDKWYSARGTLPEKLKDDHHLFIDDGASMPGFLDRDRIGLKKIALRLQLDLVNPIEYFDLPRNALTRQLAAISNSLYITRGAVWDKAGFAETGDFETEAGLHLSYRIPYWDRLFGDELLHLYLPLVISNPNGDKSGFKFRWVLSIARQSLESGN